MNATQYAEYQKAVSKFLRTFEVKPGCFGPKEENQEPYFSWRPCECCGSNLGGNREDVIFATQGGTKFEATICTDCAYYLTYDHLDDSTMLEIAESANSTKTRRSRRYCVAHRKARMGANSALLIVTPPRLLKQKPAGFCHGGRAEMKRDYE